MIKVSLCPKIASGPFWSQSYYHDRALSPWVVHDCTVLDFYLVMTRDWIIFFVLNICGKCVHVLKRANIIPAEEFDKLPLSKNEGKKSLSTWSYANIPLVINHSWNSVTNVCSCKKLQIGCWFTVLIPVPFWNCGILHCSVATL